jgi:hypothetical protein
MLDTAFLKNKYKPDEIELIKNLQIKLKDKFHEETGLIIDSVDIARIVVG